MGLKFGRKQLRSGISVKLRAAACFLAASFVFGATIGAAVQAAAQDLPTVRVLDGSLISPASAAVSYAPTTSTNGLCRDYAALPAVCATQRAPEIRELARSLRNDPELIYEFVLNGMRTDFLFGAHKGPLGVIVDRSGTAFDQAMLLVELLREAGVPARYKYGVLTLTGSEFAAWTGVSNARTGQPGVIDAKAACKLLATAGIPGTVNGTASATCAYTGAVTSVTLNHVWVEADYAGGSWFLDPSYKTYAHKAGVDVKAAVGLVAGETLTSAAPGSTGSTSGVGWAQDFNAEALAAKVEGYSDSMLARMRQADLQSADLDDVIGGEEMVAVARPAGGWRLVKPARYSVDATWTGGVPDVFRNTLRVNSAWGPNQPFDKTFFTDEIYGRRLQVEALETRLPRVPGNNNAAPFSYAPILKLDDATLATGSTTSTDGGSLVMNVMLTANHPFAAAGGAYADATVSKKLDFILPAAIVHGWGPTSRALAESWDRELGLDRRAHNAMVGGQPNGGDPLFVSAGDLMRLRIGATWLAQFSTATRIHAAIADAVPVQFHSLGVVSADSNTVSTMADPSPTPTSGQAAGFALIDQTTVIDLETSFGLVSRASNALDRRAAVHAIAATAAALEGSVIEQLTDTPDAASSARRFAWGNRPETGETPATTPRRFYRFPDTTSASSAMSLALFENSAVTGAAAPSGSLARQIGDGFRTVLSTTIQDYTAAGYDVVASGEAYLGPGHRFGSRFDLVVGYNSQSAQIITQTIYSTGLQNGAALIANRYDPSGEPIEIAHVLTRASGNNKGGGGAPVIAGYQYDPGKAADALKDRFVNRSDVVGVSLDSGTAGFNSPVLTSVGQGDFPYRLERKVELRGGGLSPRYDDLDYIEHRLNPNVDHDGMVSNWDGSAAPGNSAFEAMGQSRPDAGARTIAAFVAMQDVWRAPKSVEREMAGALVADWWTRSVLFNVVTVQHGGSSEQFIRLADETFVPAKGGSDRVEVVGQRVPYRSSLGDYDPAAQARTWVYEGVQIARVGSLGDRREYEFWKVFNSQGGYGYDVGHRLKSWIQPNGIRFTLAYDLLAPSGYDEVGAAIPTSVSSSLGYSLTLPPIGRVPGGGRRMEFTDAGGDKTAVDFLTAPPSGARPIASPLLREVYDPTDMVTPSLRYDYGLTGLVREARDGVAIREPAKREPHQFFVIPEYRGERQDPMGGRYAVETLEDGALVRVIDELNRVVTTRLDGRGRVISRTYPEGDRDVFGYDVRNNMVSLTRKPKPGSSLADIVSTVTFTEGPLVWNCISIKTCNRPLSADGPRTDVTDISNFSWNSSTGALTQVLKPADATGARPQTDFGYTSYTAGGATFSILTSITEKIDATNSTTTTFEIDQANGFLIKSGTVDSGGLNLRTCYLYNATGDIVAVSDPRTTTCPASAP